MWVFQVKGVGEPTQITLTGYIGTILNSYIVCVVFFHQLGMSLVTAKPLKTMYYFLSNIMPLNGNLLSSPTSTVCWHSFLLCVLIFQTPPGSLWAISLWDLYCHVMGHGARCRQASLVPALQEGNYQDLWGESAMVTESGAREIIR